ncbi:type III secretion system export apparatus subunit SctV [Alcaligenes endophyticus]|uniref:Type III secretion system export apparatus subunit SctV n=1 Tax=Alcaligenes endophyticus TaxID=1929088 RepID=A0ABT8EFL8_9BURK|nr:type III secretion system export apparatus subunit SctV [Alcaligenes endophyticus]MCX5590263.1 type III secretion system export apparatus subunit SctV [Alcaligenes endophyticus]MDN4120073.1 type III secretion system export apparatus subunit SctV [Alcaligenes endophyticus]
MQVILRTVGWLTSRNDIFLAFLIVAIIFMMILPLPTALVDVLIGANMTLSAILLMVAMYLPSPLAFSSFPSVLLVTTLFRLGISIATTRLILLQADAGHIIETFGNFVVGGNLVVGLVVFLILTIVQFIVITKGAERVAEVAARFSLDAMPGKQMAIDADLRAGAVDMEEARERRSLIEKESQLYGAMDGAMKFVKGDAIAGLIIVAVNLLGGIIIGTMQRGMTAGESVQVYSILTIGDGLVSQIPALFIAICAGIIVTRVQTGKEASNVGKDIGAQVLAQPKALLIAAAIAVGMGLIPGMPTLTFLILGSVVGVVGFVLVRAGNKQSKTAQGGGTSDRAPGQEQTAQPEEAVFAPALPILLDLAGNFRDSIDAAELGAELSLLRKALYLELGVPYPDIHLRFNDSLAQGTYSLLVYEVPITQGYIKPECVLVRDKPQNLRNLQLSFVEGAPIWSRDPCLWVQSEWQDTLQAAGLTYLTQIQVMSWHVRLALLKQAADFMDIQEVRFLLNGMESDFPDLVKEALRVMPVQKMAEIMQRLVAENISVRDLRNVLGALTEWGQKEKDTVLLTDYVRVSLKRYISHKYASGQNILPAYLLSPALEDLIRGAIRQTAVGSYLALDPDMNRKVLDSIKKAVGKLTPGHNPVLLTSMDIRRYVRKMIEADLYELSVLSYQELTLEVNVQPLARIELPLA